jgi:hypothetical protein
MSGFIVVPSPIGSLGIGEFEEFDGRAVFDDECDADTVGWAVRRNQDFAVS